MIVALLVLLLYIVDAVLIADGHMLHMASECVNQANASRSSSDAPNMIIRILTPHGVFSFCKFADRNLQNGRKEHTRSPRAGRDLGAWFAVLMKQMRQILASMCHQIVQGLEEAITI